MAALQPILVSIPDAARMLGIGRSKCYGLIDESRLETISIGTRRLVKVESIRRLVEGAAIGEAA